MPCRETCQPVDEEITMDQTEPTTVTVADDTSEDWELSASILGGGGKCCGTYCCSSG
jgi:hypothetical protein